MKIDIDDINYHHEYSVSLVFDAVSTASSTASTQQTTSNESKASTASTTESQVSNPQTGDATPYLLIVALVGSAFLLYRKKLQTKTEGQ